VIQIFASREVQVIKSLLMKSGRKFGQRPTKVEDNCWMHR
jgi:hypothetical protein